MPNRKRKQTDTPFQGMEDGDVAKLASSGDEDALNFLLSKYKSFARNKARSYFIMGADREDIIQEGMIGLFKAIRDYNPERQSSFYTFADLCITRQIITAVKTATRKKHIPLNSYVSIYKPEEQQSDRSLLDTLPKTSDLNPESIFIDKEGKIEIQQKILKILSPLERQVLLLYLNNKPYDHIANEIGRDTKTVDNALQRVKKKLGGYLESRD
jgi:RNA polymerase sporulation-specific sigma factor